MHDYDPMVPYEEEDMVANTPGLGEAYAVANSALEAGLGLEHWRSQFRKSVMIISSDEEGSDASLDEDTDFERDLQRAMQMSRAALYDRVSKRSPSSPLSSDETVKRQCSEEKDDQFRQRLVSKTSSTVPAAQRRVRKDHQCTSTPSPPPLDHDAKYREFFKNTTQTEQREESSVARSTESNSKTLRRSTPDDILSSGRLGKTCISTNDAVDGEL